MLVCALVPLEMSVKIVICLTEEPFMKEKLPGSDKNKVSDSLWFNLYIELKITMAISKSKVHSCSRTLHAKCFCK